MAYSSGRGRPVPAAGTAGAVSAGTAGGAAPSVRQARFARWAAHYDQSQLRRVLHEPVHRQTLAQARRRVPAPTRILDVGCGTGRLAQSCTSCFPGVPVVGIDPCAEMLHQTERASSAMWVQACVEALPFDDDSFDLVVATLSLRHWQDRSRGLAEVGRVIAPGGAVVLGDVSAAASGVLACRVRRPLIRSLAGGCPGLAEVAPVVHLQTVA